MTTTSPSRCARADGHVTATHQRDATRIIPFVGQVAELSRTVGDYDIALFTMISGDRNPLHYDDAAAKASRFGEIVVQGGVTSAILNAVVAERLPGPGTVFLNTNWDFKGPVRPATRSPDAWRSSPFASTSRSPFSRPPSSAMTARLCWTARRCATRWTWQPATLDNQVGSRAFRRVPPRGRGCSPSDVGVILCCDYGEIAGGPAV